MSAVEILAVGSQARTGTSEALDVSGFSTLRLDLTASANFGLSPWLRAYIETARVAAGPWRTIDARHYTTGSWPAAGVDRITLGGFDALVRLRWESAREAEQPSSADKEDIALVLGLDGDGQPDAA